MQVSHKDAAWEACDDFERLCAEHISLYAISVERRRSEMREKAGEAEKAGVDWTNSRLGQLEREVFELRRREDKLNQLSQTEDPIQFLQVMARIECLEVFTILYLILVAKFKSRNGFVCNRQGFRALGDLPVLTNSHGRLDMLTEFVTTQKDKLKNMFKKEKNELISHSDKHLCKCNQYL